MLSIKNILKEKKGIFLSDAIIAILIILLFTGIIVSLMTNIFLESAKIKLSSQQVDFVTEIFEYVEKIPYENVTQENLINYINEKNVDYVSAGSTIEDLTTPYKIAITVEKYNETEGNTDKLDLIKVVTVNVENNLSDKQYSTTMSKLKKRTIQETTELLKWWENVNLGNNTKSVFKTDKIYYNKLYNK